MYVCICMYVCMYVCKVLVANHACVTVSRHMHIYAYAYKGNMLARARLSIEVVMQCCSMKRNHHGYSHHCNSTIKHDPWHILMVWFSLCKVQSSHSRMDSWCTSSDASCLADMVPENAHKNAACGGRDAKKVTLPWILYVRINYEHRRHAWLLSHETECMPAWSKYAVRYTDFFLWERVDVASDFASFELHGWKSSACRQSKRTSWQTLSHES